MKILLSVRHARNNRIIKNNSKKIASNEQILQGKKKGRIKQARKAW